MLTTDYRKILEDELQARRERNPSYSLRAFARDLEVPADQLCSVLKRRYGLSRARAEAIAQQLGFSPEEKAAFGDLVEAEHGRSKGTRLAAASRAASTANASGLSMDAFKLVADWWHFAILELADLSGGALVADSIPARLNISRTQASAAVQRLKRLGLLEATPTGLAACSDQTYAPAGVASRSKRRFLAQLGSKAVEALETVPFERREYSSDILSIHHDDLPKLKALVGEFRRQLAALASAPGPKDSVYCANVQVFELAR